MAGRYEKLLDISADIEDAIEQTVKKLGLSIDRRLVMETPFRDGSAKGSWLMSIGGPVGDSVELVGANRGAAESQAIQQGAATIQNYKAYQALYVQNNQPYITRLNEGWSAQAGSGYVDAIIAQEVAKA